MLSWRSTYHSQELGGRGSSSKSRKLDTLQLQSHDELQRKMPTAIRIRSCGLFLRWEETMDGLWTESAGRNYLDYQTSAHPVQPLCNNSARIWAKHYYCLLERVDLISGRKSTIASWLELEQYSEYTVVRREHGVIILGDGQVMTVAEPGGFALLIESSSDKSETQPIMIRWCPGKCKCQTSAWSTIHPENAWPRDEWQIKLGELVCTLA